jgi:hypothetical protein
MQESEKMKYSVNLTGWGHISIRTVEADTPQEAMDKAMRQAGMSAHIRQLALISQESSEIVTKVEQTEMTIAEAHDILADEIKYLARSGSQEHLDEALKIALGVLEDVLHNDLAKYA